MHRFSKTLWLTILMILLIATAYAQESRNEKIILGEWARTTVECRRPELKFTDKQVKIRIDADGSPVAFEYAHIRYITSPNHVLVQLNSRQPYSKTPDKTSLTFEIANSDTIRMQQRKNKSTQFIRCVAK